MGKNSPSSKVHSGRSGRITPGGAWESAWAWDLTQVEHGLCASLEKNNVSRETTTIEAKDGGPITTSVPIEEDRHAWEESTR